MEILKLVKEKGPITGEEIGSHFNLSRATLRPDLAVLTMTGLLDGRPRVGYFDPGPKEPNIIADELANIKAGDVKAMPVVIKMGQSVYEAVVTMFLEDKSTLFVVNEQGKLEGVVTSKDLLKTAIGHAELKSLPVDMVMTRSAQVVSVDEATPVGEALAKLNQAQVGCLPVVKEGDIPTGRFDLNIVLKLLQEMAHGHFKEGIL